VQKNKTIHTHLGRTYHANSNFSVSDDYDYNTVQTHCVICFHVLLDSLVKCSKLSQLANFNTSKIEIVKMKRDYYVCHLQLSEIASCQSSHW